MAIFHLSDVVQLLSSTIGCWMSKVRCLSTEIKNSLFDQILATILTSDTELVKGPSNTYEVHSSQHCLLAHVTLAVTQWKPGVPTANTSALNWLEIGKTKRFNQPKRNFWYRPKDFTWLNRSSYSRPRFFSWLRSSAIVFLMPDNNNRRGNQNASESLWKLTIIEVKAPSMSGTAVHEPHVIKAIFSSFSKLKNCSAQMRQVYSFFQFWYPKKSRALIGCWSGRNFLYVTTDSGLHIYDTIWRKQLFFIRALLCYICFDVFRNHD